MVGSQFSMLIKRSSTLFSIVAILILPFSIPAAVLTDRGIGIYIDQDLFVPLYNEDRDYTMGIGLEFFWGKKQGLYFLDNLVRSAGHWIGIDKNDKNNRIVYSFLLGTLAYTPDDLAESSPIFNDRPYSSLIYISNKRVRASKRRALAAEVSIGLLGTQFARVGQTALHKIYREATNSDEPVEPRGWSHQISNGGEPTMRVRLSSSLLHDSLSREGVWDVASTTGLSLGFQTNINFSIAIRLGHIKTKFWSLPFDPVNRGSFLPSKPGNEWYFWGASRVHLIGYDALLQGQFRDSEVTYSYDELESVVYDNAIGFTAGFKETQITLSANVRSSELKNSDRRQIWGSINYLLHF